MAIRDFVKDGAGNIVIACSGGCWSKEGTKHVHMGWDLVVSL